MSVPAMLSRALLALCASVAGLTLTATPAVADDCLPAGGATMPGASSAPADEFVFHGHGWGHGVGMSQYGARGAASLGCDVEQILTTYYQDTALSSWDMPDKINVGVAPRTPSSAAPSSIQVTTLADQTAPWLAADTQLATQPAETTWTLRRAEGTFILEDAEGTPVWSGDQTVYLPLHGERTVRFEHNNRRYQRGEFRFDARGDATMDVTAVLDDLDEYLYGLGEMPSSWPGAALESQAVVGRSFAISQISNANWREGVGQSRWLSNCRCEVYDSVYSQAYVGFEKEAEGNSSASTERGTWGQLWSLAVDATSGQVLTFQGSVAAGNYAASHGGHSDSAGHVWGWDVAYLQPVDDSRWTLAGEDPFASWTVSFTPEELGEAAGVGVAQYVSVGPEFGEGGRLGRTDTSQLLVGGDQDTATFQGEQSRWAFGLRSGKFTVTPPGAAGPPSGDVLFGDWNADGYESPGWFDEGNVRLRMVADDASSDVVYTYGRAGDIPVAGDFNGDGQDTVSVVRGNRWHVNNRQAGGFSSLSFTFARSSDVPIVGDWNGDGVTTPGVRRGTEIYLRNEQSGGWADVAYTYGLTDDKVVVGDWTSDGRDTVSVVRGNWWHLRDELSGGSADVSFTYGLSSDVPVLVDLAGNGPANAVVRDQTLYARTNIGSGFANQLISLK